MSAAGLALGYGADLVVGDQRRGHPVAGFGRVAQALERRLYAPSRARGALFAGALVTGAALAGHGLSRLLGRRAALALLTWTALGGRSLRSEAAAIAEQLERGDVADARRSLPALAGRDPAALDGHGIARAVVESVAENTSDAVVGALLYAAALGPAGVAAYRAANVLDAMVGHRSPRYADFGWAAARLDDALGWPAARAAAGLTVLCARERGRAWRVLRRDGAAHPSPNAGRMEAAFAGALALRLGGPLSYGGRAELRPALGDGRAPAAADIGRANALSRRVGAAALAAAVALRALRSPRAPRGTAGARRERSVR
ncbi:MAG TPA: CobD/CbiB family cobalamin biosynthesis protein [Solirubrobacteraceae bacterium]|nr:CobD/CbiB family cobalamin biosynthesis protein [Solirubrobacteraceae bacterium]